MDLFYLDMEYDVLLILLDEDHEEVNELINCQFHLTNNFTFLFKQNKFYLLTIKMAKPKYICAEPNDGGVYFG